MSAVVILRDIWRALIVLLSIIITCLFGERVNINKLKKIRFQSHCHLQPRHSICTFAVCFVRLPACIDVVGFKQIICKKQNPLWVVIQMDDDVMFDKTYYGAYLMPGTYHHWVTCTDASKNNFYVNSKNKNMRSLLQM